MKVVSVLLCLSFLLFIHGCTSVEYKTEKSKCSGTGFAKYPSKIEQQTCNGVKPVQVADGVTCRTSGSYGYRTTTCTPKYKTNYVPYTYTCSVDVNKSARNSFIKECTKNNCMQIYGNARCEIKSQAKTKSVK